MATTSRLRRPGRIVAATAAALITLVACGNNAAGGNAASGSSSAASGKTGPNGGTILAGEPDVNHDGKVKIGVLSPGDLNDHGYYESFVVSAEAFTKQKGWELIKVGNINPADALEQARNMCRQHVDMVALAASELADAIPASTEPVCKDTAWYVPTSAGSTPQTPEIFISQDRVQEVLLTAGYAAGLLMQKSGATKAGFVAGQEADYSTEAAAAFQAGIRELIPSATVTSTYTGDNNDSALAREATQAQIDQGVGALYPYLGGGTDAAASLADEKGIPVLTPGTDRCDSTNPTFAISVIFDPGYYFKAALEKFAKGEFEVGVTYTWRIGVDPVPTVKICKPSGDEQQKVDDFMKQIGSGKIDAAAEVTRLGK